MRTLFEGFHSAIQQSMDSPTTSTATLSLLQARLQRIEHILHGPANADELVVPPAVESLDELERRFASLVASVRVYSELLKIYNAYPSLFQSPLDGVPPTQLGPDEIRATVLSYASAFPSTASALSATVNDMPVPDTALSAHLVGLVPRMEAAAARQKSLEDETAELRRRSERLVRGYYTSQALAGAQRVAAVEARFERVEGHIRRLERAREEDEKV